MDAWRDGRRPLGGSRRGRNGVWGAALAFGCGALAVFGAYTALPVAGARAGAAPALVANEAQFRDAWADPRLTDIQLTDDIFLRACRSGDPIRESARPMRLDGNGHTIRQ